MNRKHMLALIEHAQKNRAYIINSIRKSLLDTNIPTENVTDEHIMQAHVISALNDAQDGFAAITFALTQGATLDNLQYTIAKVMNAIEHDGNETAPI